VFDRLPINPLNETNQCFAPSERFQGCRVVKVGGSILFPPDIIGQKNESGDHLRQLQTRIEDWSRRNPAALNQVTVWITGTGQLTAPFKNSKSNNRLSTASAHWTSIEFMDRTVEILGSQFPSWRLTTSLTKTSQLNCIADHGSSTNIAFAAYRWMLHAAAKQIWPILPESSDVTSDSIAAWIAIQLSASELKLLKSCSIPNADIQSLSKLGIVDAHLPTLAPILRSQSISFRCERI
jgi:aspartokinase-like uncharacterized kinase